MIIGLSKNLIIGLNKNLVVAVNHMLSINLYLDDHLYTSQHVVDFIDAVAIYLWKKILKSNLLMAVIDYIWGFDPQNKLAQPLILAHFCW